MFRAELEVLLTVLQHPPSPETTVIWSPARQNGLLQTTAVQLL